LVHLTSIDQHDRRMAYGVWRPAGAQGPPQSVATTGAWTEERLLREGDHWVMRSYRTCVAGIMNSASKPETVILWSGRGSMNSPKPSDPTPRNTPDSVSLPEHRQRNSAPSGCHEGGTPRDRQRSALSRGPVRSCRVQMADPGEATRLRRTRAWQVGVYGDDDAGREVLHPCSGWSDQLVPRRLCDHRQRWRSSRDDDPGYSGNRRCKIVSRRRSEWAEVIPSTGGTPTLSSCSRTSALANSVASPASRMPTV
jgi:hypothetical protein